MLVAAVTQTAPRPFCSAPAAAGRRRMQWCDVSVANMSKNVFSVVKTSYTDGCFEKLNFATWDDNIEFLEHTEKLDLVFVYAYALLDSWERLYPDKQEITDIDLKNEIGFDKIFGLNEDECNYVIDSLAYEGILTVNRQLYPATLIRTSNADSIIPQLYSSLRYCNQRRTRKRASKMDAKVCYRRGSKL